MMCNPWAYGFEPTKHPHYQPVVDCTHWPVLCSFDNYNIIKCNNEITSCEDFDEVHKVVLDDISDNMASLVQLDK